MLEGVLKDYMALPSITGDERFNPWYVGGGVKSHHELYNPATDDYVSILGMLEGVLKGSSSVLSAIPLSGFNPWYVGGGVKRPIYMYLPHA